MTGTLADADFATAADPFRRELFAHCYRMLGSVQDAEDQLQETYLKAWRACEKFEGRSSLRTWLYRIATTTCLTALKSRGRRPLPAGLGRSSDPSDGLDERQEVPWLEPVPDAMVLDTDDPAVVVAARESVRLALVAALQHLPPRQRAVLVLREVLAWRASEVADLLGTTTTAVNSVLQRARAQLDQVAARPDELSEPATADQRELLDRYVSAFQAKDVPAIVSLLTDDVVWEMPPFAAWYQGPARVGTHLSTRCPGGPGDFELVEVGANGQPGFALYLRGKAFGLQVLTVTSAGIAHVANFMDPSVFAVFGLPDTR